MSLPLTGCLLNFDEGGTSRGVPLSSAMKASASGGGHVSGGHSDYYSGSPVDVDIAGGVASGGDGGDETMVDYGGKTYCWQIPVDVSYSIPLNGEILAITRFTLTPIAIESDHQFVGLFVSGDLVDLQPDSLPAAAVKDTIMLEGGISYRYYFTPAHTFISPYFSANASYQLLGWQYKNPVIAGGDTITGDSLNAVGGYAGFGIALKRNSYVSIFGEAGFGGTAFLPQTEHGFDNDVFSNFGYFTIKAGVSFKF